MENQTFVIGNVLINLPETAKVLARFNELGQKTAYIREVTASDHVIGSVRASRLEEEIGGLVQELEETNDVANPVFALKRRGLNTAYVLALK